MRLLTMILVFLFSTSSLAGTLTPDQKQRFKNLAKSYAEIQKLTNGFLSTDRQVQPQVFTEKDLPPIDESTCEIDIPYDEFGELKAGEDLTIPTFTMEIKGDTCPVHIKGSIGGEQKGDFEFTALFEWTYIGKAGEYKEAYDIHEITLKGTITAKLEQLSDGFNMNMLLQLDGNGDSKLEGRFVNNVKGVYEFEVRGGDQSRNSQNMGFGQLFKLMNELELKGRFSQIFELSFAEVKAQAEERTIIDGILSIREEHYVDSELVTPEEYREFMKDIQFPGMNFGKDDGGEGSAKDFAGVCQVNMYDASKVSKQQAEERFKNGMPIIEPPLTFFNSCFGDNQQQSADGKTVETIFKNNKDHMQISTGFQGEPLLEFFVLEEEDLSLAESYGAATVTVQCYSQRRCAE